MTKKQQDEITKISKEFSEPFYETFDGIEKSTWFIVDPLSGYLNACGFENKLHQMPATEKHPLVLIMTFKDGTKFIPAGGDLKELDKGFTNWIWIAPTPTTKII